MNNKGSVYVYGIMLALTIIILISALSPSLKQFTESARNATVGDTIGMDCSNDSISNFQKASCIATDLNLFFFVGAILLIGGGIIVTKIIF